MSKHHWYVKEVFKYLHKTGLYAKVEKCKFHSKLVEYLEYILFPSGLTISDEKVKIIQGWPKSKKINPSYVLQISITSSFSNIQTLLFHWHISPGRIFSGNSTHSVIILSTPSRMHSPLLLFLLIEFQMLNSSWKLMLWTMLLLDNRTSILKGGILAMPQSTLTTSNQSSLNNSLQPLYELLFSSFPLSIQLQLLIWTLYIKTFFQLSLII